jgi:hypothetical protein
LCIATAFTYASIPLALCYLTTNVRGTSAMTVAVAMNIALSFTGQIIGAHALYLLSIDSYPVVGLYIYRPSEAPAYPTGHFTNAAAMLVSAVAFVALRVVYWRKNRHLVPGERPWVT